MAAIVSDKDGNCSQSVLETEILSKKHRPIAEVALEQRPNANPERQKPTTPFGNPFRKKYGTPFNGTRSLSGMSAAEEDLNVVDATSNSSTTPPNFRRSDSSESYSPENLIEQHTTRKPIQPFNSSQRQTPTTFSAESSSTSITSLNLSAMNCNDDTSSTTGPLALDIRENELGAGSTVRSNCNDENGDKDEIESTGNMSETDRNDNDHERDESTKPHNLFSRIGKKIHLIREAVGKIINNDYVQYFMVLLIIVNALMMGIATLDFVADSEQVSRRFEITDLAFLIVFTIEISMQLIYRGLWHVVTDGWLCFDFIIVVASWSFQSSNLQVLRSCRVFRAFRLITRLTVLQNLVQALFDVAPSVTAIVSLLLLILYIFAVLCTELFGPLYDEGVLDGYNYFGRLDTSLFTLFQMVTLDWAEIVRPIANVYGYAKPLFTTFLIITSFILYSLVVAVVCDAVMVIERNKTDEEEKDEKEVMKKQIEQLQKRVSDLTVNQEKLLRMLQDTMRQLEDLSESATDDGIFFSLDDDNAFFSVDGSVSTEQSSSPETLSRERWRGASVEMPLAHNGSAAAAPSTTPMEINVATKRAAG